MIGATENGDECSGGKQVVLAAFVEDAEIGGGERVLVGQRAVDFVQLQGNRVVVVFDTEDVLAAIVCTCTHG